MKRVFSVEVVGVNIARIDSAWIRDAVSTYMDDEIDLGLDEISVTEPVEQERTQQVECLRSHVCNVSIDDCDDYRLSKDFAQVSKVEISEAPHVEGRLVTISFVAKALVLLLAIFFFAGCPRVCENAQTRCTANTVQICTSRGRWQTLYDCKEVLTRSGKSVPGTCEQPPRCVEKR